MKIIFDNNSSIDFFIYKENTIIENLQNLLGIKIVGKEPYYDPDGNINSYGDRDIYYDTSTINLINNINGEIEVSASISDLANVLYPNSLDSLSDINNGVEVKFFWSYNGYMDPYYSIIPNVKKISYTSGVSSEENNKIYKCIRSVDVSKIIDVEKNFLKNIFFENTINAQGVFQHNNNEIYLPFAKEADIYLAKYKTKPPRIIFDKTDDYEVIFTMKTIIYNEV